MLYVDPDRFIQVVTNLLGNALKFSPADQEIVAGLRETRRQYPHQRARPRPRHPGEFKPRIFQTFAQADGGGKKGGSGLGLSIAQRIVAGMHGHIGFAETPTAAGRFFTSTCPMPTIWRAGCTGSGRRPRAG